MPTIVRNNILFWILALLIWGGGNPAWADAPPAPEDIYPDATGSPDDWSNVGGANKVASVSDAVDANYIEESTDGQKQRFTLENPTEVEGGDIIDSVKIMWRGKESTSGDNRAQMHQYVSTDHNDGTDTYLTTSWVDYEDNFTLAPDGGAWTLSDLNDLQLEAHAVDLDGFGRRVQVTKLYAKIYYHLATPANSLSSDSLMFSIPIINDVTNEGSADSLKYFLSHDSLFANSWLLRSVSTVPAADTFVVYNLNPGESFWLTARLYASDAIADSDSLNVMTATTKYNPIRPTGWNYIEDDTFHTLDQFGNDRRYNYDSSGTWTEINPEWQQKSAKAVWTDSTGYYISRIDSTTRHLMKLDTDSTNYQHMYEIAELVWWDPDDSSETTALDLYTNNDSIEVRFDTLIFHGVFYKCDVKFIYGRNGFSELFVISAAARDSLDDTYTAGDYLAVKSNLITAGANMYFEDDVGVIDIDTSGGHDVSGDQIWRDNVSADSGIILTVVEDTPYGDSVFEASAVFRRYYYSGAQYSYEMIDYGEWQDSSATGDINFFANYIFDGVDYIEDNHLDANSKNANYGSSEKLWIWRETTQQNYALLRVLGLDSIPATATIDNAMLYLNTGRYIFDPIDQYVCVYRLFKPWVEDDTGGTTTGGVTWNDWASEDKEWGIAGADSANDSGDDNDCDGSVPSGECSDRDSTAQDSIYVANPRAWYSWDLTSLAGDWHDGTADENGVLLRQNADGKVGFSSSEQKRENPYLEVEWSLPSGGEAATGAQVIITGGS